MRPCAIKHTPVHASTTAKHTSVHACATMHTHAHVLCTSEQMSRIWSRWLRSGAPSITDRLLASGALRWRDRCGGGGGASLAASALVSASPVAAAVVALRPGMPSSRSVVTVSLQPRGAFACMGMNVGVNVFTNRGAAWCK
eukprot:115923-Chlamydomonas_euryale.AAC.2